ncbi:MAG TPA: tetratricopeptide repeat protein, partial [Candidatus Angelobacter sp.]|nr:tetratricopeptide repeat protein [Candidatus Angelobacter sp.]
DDEDQGETMTPERWTRLKEIFHAVADQPLEGRHSVVLRECQGDMELQQELEQLLAQDEEMGNFLEGEPAAVTEPTFESGNVLNPGERLNGRYKIVRFLGAGGSGEVYEAEDELLSTRIALKIIGREASLGKAALDRLRQEVQAAHRVTNDNVCRIYDLQRDLDRDIVFLTMELVPGETLLARLRRLGKLDRKEALLVAGQLCRGIAAAHRAGVLHRDLKCSNVMLEGSGNAVRAVITDFGTALRLDPAEAVASPIAFYGTVAYCSPEQLQGEKSTQASDIYALGLIFYEMLTGQRPFRSNSQLVEAVNRLTNDRVKLENLPNGSSSSWGHIIQGCLARDPQQRFASVEEVETAVNRIGKEWEPWVRWIAAALIILAFGIRISNFFQSTEPRQVAVLPFQISTANSPDQALADGLAESLSDNLSELELSQKSLWVVPWSKVREIPFIHNIASPSSALGVDRVITGSLEQRDGEWVVHLTLEDGKSHRILGKRDVRVREAAANQIEASLLKQAASMLNVKVSTEANTRLNQQQTPVPGGQEFYERGRGYLSRHNLESAIDQLEKAIAKDPGFTEAHAYLSYAYALSFWKTGDRSFFDKFQQVYDRTSTSATDWAPRHMARALILKQKEDLPGAIQELERARQLDPESEDVRFLLASDYDKTGKLEDAEKLLKETIQQHPASWLSRDQLGQIYFSHARYDEAERYFREASDLAPDDPMAWVNLGAINLAHGRYSEAIPFLQKAAALKQDAGAYGNLGVALFYLGRNAESIAAFEKAAALLPNNHLMWRNLGDGYTKAGNKAKAADAYRKAIRILEKDLADRPHDGNVLESLSLYHAKLGEKKQAQLRLDQAGESLPKNPQALFDLTLIYELTGNRDKALAALQSTVKSGFPKSEIQNSIELEQLRKDKRYSKVMESSNL